MTSPWPFGASPVRIPGRVGMPAPERITEKRTAESRYFAVDCSALLGPDATITGITSISDDAGALTFSAGKINDAAVQINGAVVEAGQGIAVLVSGGSIPAGAPSAITTVRVIMATSCDPAVEATWLMLLRDRIDVAGVPHG